jgi:hypothetical protein
LLSDIVSNIDLQGVNASLQVFQGDATGNRELSGGSHMLRGLLGFTDDLAILKSFVLDAEVRNVGAGVEAQAIDLQINAQVTATREDPTWIRNYPGAPDYKRVQFTFPLFATARRSIERKGRFYALHSDRASHYFQTPTAGGPVDRHSLTQVGRALKKLGIEMIPAYSPQARGRSERRFGTWQGRLPQELRLAGIRTVEEATGFPRTRYVGKMNRQFSVLAAQSGDALVPLHGQDLDRIFSVQHERRVAKDHTVRRDDRTWQIEKTSWRGALADCRVTVCEHLHQTVSIVYSPHVVGRYTTNGKALEKSKSAGGQRLEIRHLTPDSDIPTATTAASVRILGRENKIQNRTDHLL